MGNDYMLVRGRFTMKSITKIFVLCSLFILAACSDTDSSKKEKNQESTETQVVKSSVKESQEQEKLFVEVPDSVETDNEGIATINGKTFANAKVKIGMGIFGDSSKADSNGNFSLTHKASDKSEDITINVDKDKESISAKVKIVLNPEIIAKQRAGEEKAKAEREKEKNEQEYEDNLGTEPKDMKTEASEEDLKRFKVKNKEFRTNMYSSKGNFEFKTAKVFDTSAGKVLVLQYYLTTTEGSKYEENGKDELPSLYQSFNINGKVEGGETYNEDLTSYLYNGEKGVNNYEGILPLSNEDYEQFPILKEIAHSNEVDDNKYPIGEKVLVSEGYYLSRNDIKSVHITLSQAPKAELWLAVN